MKGRRPQQQKAVYCLWACRAKCPVVDLCRGQFCPYRPALCALPENDPFLTLLDARRTGSTSLGQAAMIPTKNPLLLSGLLNKSVAVDCSATIASLSSSPTPATNHIQGDEPQSTQDERRWFGSVADADVGGRKATGRISRDPLKAIVPFLPCLYYGET